MAYNIENFEKLDRSANKDVLVKLLDTIISLSTEQDNKVLLTKLLDSAMEFAGCDAGTLYIVEGNHLAFSRIVTKSLGIKKGGYDDAVDLPPVPLLGNYACARCALDNRTYNITNVHSSLLFDFSGTIEYDRITGYYTKSMLIVPLTKDSSNVVGVLQLINAQNEQGEIIQFNPEIELIIKTLASQAAISIVNLKNNKQLTRMMESIVNSLSAVIDSRSYYTTNHTENMVKYAGKFLDWLKSNNSDWEFDDNKRKSFMFAVRLHDIGKVAIPAEILDKPTRLYGIIDLLYARFKELTMQAKIDRLEGRISFDDEDRIVTEIKSALSIINQANAADVVDDKLCARLRKIYEKGLLSDREFSSLTIAHGTLSAEEREVIKSHAVYTKKILENVYYPKEYENVAGWASKHHEYLNGKGYPDGLTAAEIPNEVRLLTIIDIYDALTASDRPYNIKHSPDEAFAILRKKADAGELDSRILNMFIESEAWK